MTAHAGHLFFAAAGTGSIVVGIPFTCHEVAYLEHLQPFLTAIDAHHLVLQAWRPTVGEDGAAVATALGLTSRSAYPSPAAVPVCAWWRDRAR